MGRKKKQKKKGTFFIILGIILLLGALGLTLYNQWDARRAGKAAQEIVDQIIDQRPDPNKPLITDPNAEMPTITIDGREYIGTIVVPSKNIELPVMAEWSYANLNISPCRYTGSYYSDDLVICGHNYITHFSPLKFVDINADVFFVNVEGTVFHYVVNNVETLQPTQVEDMITGDDWDLSLFTCNTGGRTRCTVRCTRVED